MKPVSIDPFTSAVSALDMYYEETHLSRGTGFFWKDNGEIFLITNWHNVSGIDPFTRKHISPTAAEPNKLTFDVFENGDLNKRRTATLQLFNNEKAAWLEHPVLGSGVDVVAIRIQMDGHGVFPINEMKSDSIVTKVGLDVFILGYPMGIDIHRLPVWKRGSVASEPEIDVDDLPMFYIDTATAKGMSGSPVIRRGSAGEVEGGNFVLGAGTMSRFVGIYSGRLTPKKSSEAHLGIVWKERVISEIIRGGRAGAIR